jgi:acylphosphatase
MEEDKSEQHEIYYSGRVQGVGFRYTARAIAAAYKVTGFVKNLPDGRVQLVLEGRKDEIQLYLKSLQAELGAYIRDAQATVRPATERFKGFEIRF